MQGITSRFVIKVQAGGIEKYVKKVSLDRLELVDDIGKARIYARRCDASNSMLYISSHSARIVSIAVVDLEVAG